MTIRTLQEELEKERAILKVAKDRIALQNKEIEELKKQLSEANVADDALADANHRFAELVNHLQNGVFLVDEHRKITIVNEPFCRLMKIEPVPENLTGTSGATLTDEISQLFKDPAQFVARVEEIIRDRKTVIKEELELRSGQVFTRDFIPLFFNGEYKGHLWKYADVTRSRTIEATFSAQKNFYEQILDHLPADVAVLSKDLLFLYVNPTAVNDPDLRKWLIGKNTEEYCEYTKKSKEFVEKRLHILNEVTTARRETEWEEKFMLPDGTAKHQWRKMFPVLNDRGEIAMIIGYGMDVTQRRNAEEQILLSEKRYRDIFNFSQAWIGTHDIEGKFVTINAAACKLLGYNETELIGRKMDFLIPEKYRQQFSDNYLRTITKEGKAEGIMTVLGKDGKNIHLLYQNFLVNEPGSEPYIIGFAQDITERIHAEEALKKSEQKYKEIIENMNLGMIEMDTEERIVYANQRFCTMSGYEPDELIGQKATDLFLRGASLKRTRDQLSKRQYGITKSYELAIKTKSGEDKYWLTSAAPLFNTDESLKGTIGIHLDITEQKKLEDQLREAQQETERSSRSKDMFLTNMSHEIRTPLNAIMGLGKLLTKSELDVQQKNYLNGIESASTNLLNIVNDLLDFSKIEAGKISLENISFNLEVISEQVITILTHKAEEKGLVLSYEIDPKIAPILIGDPFRINQVFMNMVSNAIKFTEKGSVYLKAFLLEENDGWQKILIVIEDTGVGIKEEYLKKLFDKFTQEDETVVRKFGGTGLGMSITKQLMELMGGSISVDSRKNSGTTVSLTFNFKIGTARVIEKKRTIKNDTSNINNKKILLVEDNNLNRLLAFTILTDYGAIVAEAENGAIAVEMMKNDTYDIVLMDIQMPVMDGIKATKIIRKEISSTIPILALTANAIKGKEHEFMDAGMNDFIVKPYNEINLVNPIAKWISKHTTDASPAGQAEEVTVIDQAAETKATNNEALYDLTKLLNMGRNDPSFIKKMLRLFITETPPSISQLIEAYNIGDLDTVKYLAHRTKPSIVNLAITSLKDDILTIEFIKEKNPEMDRLINKLQKVIDLVIEKLKQEYNL